MGSPVSPVIYATLKISLPFLAGYLHFVHCFFYRVRPVLCYSLLRRAGILFAYETKEWDNPSHDMIQEMFYQC